MVEKTKKCPFSQIYVRGTGGKPETAVLSPKGQQIQRPELVSKSKVCHYFTQKKSFWLVKVQKIRRFAASKA